MDVITITIESDDPALLHQELIAARDHGEGVYIRTGGDGFVVEVLSVSKRELPARVGDEPFPYHTPRSE